MLTAAMANAQSIIMVDVHERAVFVVATCTNQDFTLRVSSSNKKTGA